MCTLFKYAIFKIINFVLNSGKPSKLSASNREKGSVKLCCLEKKIDDRKLLYKKAVLLLFLL